MTQQRDLKIKKGEKADQVTERKAYLKPQLIKYGHLEKMTQSGTGPFADRSRLKWGSGGN